MDMAMSKSDLMNFVAIYECVRDQYSSAHIVMFGMDHSQASGYS